MIFKYIFRFYGFIEIFFLELNVRLKSFYIYTDQTTTFNNDKRYSRGARIKRSVESTDNQQGK